MQAKAKKLTSSVIDNGKQSITVENGRITKLVEFYTAKDVAALLGCHWYTVMALGRSGQLKGHKILGKWRFTAQAIHEYVAGKTNE